MNFAETRLRNQQLVHPRFDTPEELVSYMGAMQAQENRLVRWAVAMRTRKPSARAFERAFNTGGIVRTHLLRGTWQLVAKEDYAWMLKLFGGRARKVIAGWMAANGISISVEESEAVAAILERTASELHSATKEDFANAVSRELGPMEDHRLSYHIRYAELSGLLCSGDLLPMKPSYSLVSEKLGIIAQTPAEITPEERDCLLKKLALRYFESRSPATLEDFVWWSSLSKRDCKRAMELLGGSLQKLDNPASSEDVREFFILDSCIAADRRSKSTLLLPPYDEYLIGYKSRDLVLRPEHTARAHNNSGNFSPVIVIDGQISGNWHPFSKKPAVEFFCSEAARDISSEWTEYCRFRGCF